MTQKEKEQACVKICAYACKKAFIDTYPEEEKKSIVSMINKLIDDIESHLNIIYNGDRTSIVESTDFILTNINALQYIIEKERMDLYNADIVDIMDTY